MLYLEMQLNLQMERSCSVLKYTTMNLVVKLKLC